MRMKLEKEPLLFRIMPWLVGIWFVLMAVFFVGVVVLIFKVGGEVNEYGLKAAIERVWCGASGCK